MGVKALITFLIDKLRYVQIQKLKQLSTKGKI